MFTLYHAVGHTCNVYSLYLCPSLDIRKINKQEINKQKLINK